MSFILHLRHSRSLLVQMHLHIASTFQEMLSSDCFHLNPFYLFSPFTISAKSCQSRYSIPLSFDLDDLGGCDTLSPFCFEAQSEREIKS